MTREAFIELFTKNSGADEVLTEINRLYDFEAAMTEKVPQIETERDEFKNKYNEANERYIKRFLSGDDKPSENKDKQLTFDSLFKEG